MRKTRTVTADDGEYIPLPNTTSHVLIGPGKVTITRYADGKVAGTIVEGYSGSSEVAVKRKLKRVSWEI